ncbi:thioredoxin family protein [Ensifer sp. HO-A22]|uniref:Thioredoxin family protein n=1 Tax=Ensifer oleiphilus TaxID=2742698 RepID=A0A7Y6Q9K2_9HYPH|nr:thioredoxin family protein [Ensifer oleiphilus]NVD41603.1 thioredoxin family protein [Ensifer oleiphilus]
MRQEHAVVSPREWLEARKALLELEKEHTHLRDKVNKSRLALPWVRMEKSYIFDTPNGQKSLAELFDGRSQLVVYHFMFGPTWEAGCPGCSFLVDHFDGMLPHLNHHDVTLIAASNAPLSKLEAYRKRMNWHFPWVSAEGNGFNSDFHVAFTQAELADGKVVYNFTETESGNAHEELPGLSAFQKADDGTVYHTYSTYARGLEEMVGTLMLLDRAPKGRNEDGTQGFVRRHDEYEDAPRRKAG